MHFSCFEWEVWEIQFCRVGGGDGVFVREDDFDAVLGWLDVGDWKGQVDDTVEKVVRGTAVGDGWFYHL